MLHHRSWIVGGFVLLWAGLTAAAPPDGAEVSRLIKQLGSGMFAEREEASKALEALGPLALDALRKAANNPDEDAEVRRRAEDLIKAIEKKAETNEILTPTRVTLNFTETPLPVAVQELARQTSYAIRLNPDSERKLADKKITLHTKELTFWEALDQFCAAAQLTQQIGGYVEQPNAPQPVPQPGVQPPQPQPARNLRRRPAIQQFDSNLIMLSEGTPPAAPTFYAGAVRIRALPPANSAQPAKGEATVTLEIVAEPKLQLRYPLTIKVDHAVDDKGQPVGIAMDGTSHDPQVLETIVLNNGVIIQRAVVGNGKVQEVAFVGQAPAPTGQGRHTLRLKLPDDAGKSLKALKGVVIGQTTRYTPITVDDVMTAAGKTFKAKDVELKILRVDNLGNGQFRICYNLSGSADDGGAVVFPGGNIQMKVVVVGEKISAPGGAPQFTLYDADGQPFIFTGQGSMQTVGPNGMPEIQRFFLFNSLNAQAVPKKLICNLPRQASVDIPFELKNVPLP
jgi:hypothetical protein